MSERKCWDCDEPAAWTWFNGMGATGRYCARHAREQLDHDADDDLPSYKDPATTEENVTLLRGRTAIIPGGGVKPLGESLPVIRSREAFDRITGDRDR